MGRLRSLLRLSPADRRLVLRSWATQAWIRGALWIMPFGSLRRLVVHRSRPASHPIAGVDPDRVAWAVAATARLVPASSCLTQALTAEVILGRARIPARLSIGVDRSTGDLRAHAWLESGGRIVVGDHDLDRFTVLPAIDGEAP